MTNEPSHARIVVMPHEQDPSHGGHRFSLSNADEFGRIETLIARADGIPPFHFDRSRKRASERLDEIGFDPRRDFVALTGNVMYITATIVEVAARARDRGVPIKLLAFDSSASKYTSKLLPTD